MTSHMTKEQRKAWREKKLSEDPLYFKKQNKKYYDKMMNDPKLHAKYRETTRKWYAKNNTQQREYKKKWLAQHPEYKDYFNNWNHTRPEGYFTEKKKEWRQRVGLKNSLYVQEWYKKHPEAYYAHIITHAKKLPLPEFCETCPEDDRNKAVQRHHPDYDYPLIVVGCCVTCHYYLNKERPSQEPTKGTK